MKKLFHAWWRNMVGDRERVSVGEDFSGVPVGGAQTTLSLLADSAKMISETWCLPPPFLIRGN